MATKPLLSPLLFQIQSLSFGLSELLKEGGTRHHGYGLHDAVTEGLGLLLLLGETLLVLDGGSVQMNVGWIDGDVCGKFIQEFLQHACLVTKITQDQQMLLTHPLQEPCTVTSILQLFFLHVPEVFVSFLLLSESVVTSHLDITFMSRA